jgi:hypothetical protein
MTILINLSAGIIDQCLALHFKHHPFGRRHTRNLLWIPLILLIISGYLIYTELEKDRLGQNFYLALLYCAFAAGYYFYMKKRLLKAGKIMLKSLGDNAHFTMEVDNTNVKTTTSSAVLSTKWNVFIAALIEKEIVLLYQTNDTFSMFHHSFFKKNDFDEFKKLVRNNVQPLIEV